MKLLLVTPPMVQLNTPYPATAYLTGYLRSRGYDVVQADAEYIVQLKDAGLIEPLDLSEFPQVNDFQDQFKPESELVPGLVLDGQPYGLIMRFGFLELAYNTEHVTEQDAQSYEILFDPKVSGKIGWFDWWAHMGPIGLYEGAKGSWWPPGKLDPYDISEDQFQTMVDTVKSLKPATAGFYSIADLFGVFANGEIWIQPAGGGWTALLLEAEGHPIAASIPKEGAIQWTETLGIFKDAKNKAGAKTFVSFMLDEPILGPYVEGSLGRWFPVTKAGQQSAFWKSDPHRQAVYNQFMAGTSSFEFTKNYKFTVLNNENVWAKAMNRILSEKVPVDKAVDEMIARIKVVAN